MTAAPAVLPINGANGSAAHLAPPERDTLVETLAELELVANQDGIRLYRLR